MLPNIVKQGSIKYKKDEELTDLERINKQLLLQNQKSQEQQHNQSLKKFENDNKNNQQLRNQLNELQCQREPIIINSTDQDNNIEQRQYAQVRRYLKQRVDLPQPKQLESTENDLLLAQLLQSEINKSPILSPKKFQENNKEKQKNNINIPPELLLSEKDKNFLNQQEEEFKKYQIKKDIKLNVNQLEQNQLMEVNDSFFENIFNKQYPINQKILQQLNTDQSEKISRNNCEQSNKITLSKKEQEQEQYISPNVQQNMKKNILNTRSIDEIQYCSLCGEYQRQSQLEDHLSRCIMANVQCEFCEKQYARYIINDHTADCLRKEEHKLIQLYQRNFAEEGLEINQTHQIFFGSREAMRRQFNHQQFEQDKEIERIIVQNQRKIKKSYINKVSKSEYYAEVKYVKESSSQQADDCCICCTTFIEKEKLGMLPCAHKFHTNCIDNWIQIKKLCPLCKRPF